ncbi:MAG TPA: TonB-dependent receptor [Candidatus Polarisedimenticolia bacterium]|nr:TonB-dependent receptor [Candidatus Polarisedimenticolia bacterium]
MRGLLRAAVLVLCAATRMTAGQDQEETVRVEAEGERAPIDRTGFSTTIRAEDFASRITSLAELLEESAGLRVRSYGGLGGFATVSIRGSTAEQVNVYVDGILMNPALGGGVNLADLPLGNIESIEIYRGFTPAHLESGSIGGAINIKRRRPPEGGRTASGSLSYGTLDTAEANALAAWTGGGRRRADAMVSFAGMRTDGDFRFFDNNGTPQEASDDGFTTRLNNRSWSGEVLSRGGFDLAAGTRLDLEGSFTRREQGVPGIDAFQSPTAAAEMTRGLFKTGLSRRRLFTDGLSLDVDLYYSRTSQGFEDRAGDTTGGLATDTQTIMQAAGPSILVRWHGATPAARPHYLTFLTTARLEDSRRTERLNPEPDRGRAVRMSATANVEDEIHLAGGRLILAPSLRWTSYHGRFEADDSIDAPPAARDSDTELSGRFGAAWHAGAGLTFRGSAGRFHRLPSFTEIFGDQGSVKGGGDLLPEAGWNYDVGLAWTTSAHGLLNRAWIETVLFRSDATNLIQFVQTSQSQVTAQNTGEARVVGAELSLDLALFGWMDGGMNYTWQVARDRSDTFRNGSDLPGRPRHELSARAGAALAGGRWGHATYRFDYLGPNFFDPAAAVVEGGTHVSRDEVRVPGRYLHGLGYTRPAGSRLEVTVEVDNLFNIKTVDVARFPLPGRLAQAKISVKLP